MRNLNHNLLKALTLLTTILTAMSTFAATWEVGPGRAYESPAALSEAGVIDDGDTVLIYGNHVYEDSEAVVLWRNNDLTIRGILVDGKRPIMDTTGYYTYLSEISMNLDEIWELRGDLMVVENIEFTGANQGSPGNDSGGVGAGIGIRCPDSTLNSCANRVTIRNCYFHHNEVGLQAFVGYPGNNIELTVEGCEFAFSGDLDSNWSPIGGWAYSHNVYIGRIKKFIMKSSYSHSAMLGHEVKSRARENHILYNRIATGTIAPFNTGSCNIDIPNAGLTYVIGNELYKGPDSDNYSSIQYGCESTANSIKDIYIYHNTFVSDDRGRGLRLCGSDTAQGTKIKIINNIYDGFTNDNADGIFRSEGSGSNFYTPLNNFASDNLTSGSLFVDRDEMNYLLAEHSPGINEGTHPGTAHGLNLTPLFEYVHPVQVNARPVSGALDLGAHEHVTLTSKLTNAILLMQVLCGLHPDTIADTTDIDSDMVLGLPEVLHFLQEIENRGTTQ